MLLIIDNISENILIFDMFLKRCYLENPETVTPFGLWEGLKVNKYWADMVSLFLPLD